MVDLESIPNKRTYEGNRYFGILTVPLGVEREGLIVSKLKLANKSCGPPAASKIRSYFVEPG